MVGAAVDATLLRTVRVIVAVGLLAALLIAPKLWFHHPFFVPLPPLPWLPSIPAPLDPVVYAVLVILLPPIALLRQPRLLMLVWCTLFALKAATDLSVWQPYFYQYVVMLLALQLVDGGGGRTPAKSVLNVMRLIVVAVYFWSGLNKVNYRFLTAGLEAVPGLQELLAPFSTWVPPRALAGLSILMPFVEIGVAVGLLVPRVRRAAVVVAIAMHALLLLSLGPLGRNLNEIVWPWNVAMAVFVYLLFRQRVPVSARAILWNTRSRLHLFVFALFVVGPFLGLFGLWPASLSFKLYSYRFHGGDIYVKETLRTKLPPDVQAQFQPVSVYFDTGGGAASRVGPYVAGVSISDWSERELNAFIPSEPRVYSQVLDRVCLLASLPTDALLLLVSPPDLLTGVVEQSIIPCTTK